MKKLGIFFSVLFFLVSCSSTSNFEKAGLVPSTYYKFSSSRINKSLYIKILPQSSDGKYPLIFKTIDNNEEFKPFVKGEEGVYFHPNFFVGSDGKVSFRIFESDSYLNKRQNHPYHSSGSNEGENKSSFRYSLDFKKAVVVQ